MVAGKLEQFRTRFFPAEADAALIQDGTSRRYLLGFPSSAGTVLVFAEQAYFIIDSRYYEAACRVVQDCAVLLQEDLYSQIAELLCRHGAKTVAVEDDKFTLNEFAQLKEHLKEFEPVSGTNLCHVLWQMRLIKTADELACIRRAQEVTDAAFAEILNFIAVGRTEREIAAELEYRMKRLGADDLSFETICVSGENSSLPHGVPGNRLVQSGDLITLDFGALVDGYHSDMTRTVAVGKVSEEQQHVYETVLEAQLAALAAICPGASCCGIDKIARDVIDAKGYAGCFGHSLGHGVGMDIHEYPTFSMRSDEILEENMVITVEPGVYLPGKFGVRIEDFVVTTAEGCENFTKSPKNFICL